MPTDEELATLHRCFIRGNLMRTHFYALLGEQGAATDDEDGFPTQYVYMSLWYACLYVLAEGWQELGLSDPDVDKLLRRTHLVAGLKKFRNSVFHYQREYMGAKELGFVLKGQDSAAWASKLNSAFGRWFLETLRARRASNTGNASS